MRGYIAMLATRKDYRGHGIATSLVKMAIEKMISEDADEVRTYTSLCAILPLAFALSQSHATLNTPARYIACFLFASGAYAVNSCIIGMYILCFYLSVCSSFG